MADEDINNSGVESVDPGSTTGELPAKTCSIERLITRTDDIERVTTGTKTSTRRNGRYADVGEVMELAGQRFVVTRVYRQRLSEMTDADFRSEGFDSQEAYAAHIQHAHNGMPIPWIQAAKVWVHEFKPASE